MKQIERDDWLNYPMLREVSHFKPAYWGRGRKMVAWILFWMLGLPLSMFGFFSMLLWAYGVDG